MTRAVVAVALSVIVLVIAGCGDAPQAASAAPPIVKTAPDPFAAELSTVKNVSIRRVRDASARRPIVVDDRQLDARGWDFDSILHAMTPRGMFLQVEAELPEGLFDVSVQTPGRTLDDCGVWFSRAMMQDYGMVVTIGPRQVEGYRLGVSNAGHALKAASRLDQERWDEQGGGLTARGVSMDALRLWLERRLGVAVDDATGLVGQYNFDLSADASDLDSMRAGLEAIGLTFEPAAFERYTMRVTQDKPVRISVWSK